MPIGIQGEHVNLALVLTSPTSTAGVSLIIKDTNNNARPLRPNERLLIDTLIAEIPVGVTASVVDGATSPASGGILSDYHFSEGSGVTAADFGPRNVPATLSSASWGGPVGQQPASMLCNGSSIFASGSDVGLPSGASPWGIFAWYNTSSTSFGGILSWGTPGANQTVDIVQEGNFGVSLDAYAGGIGTVSSPPGTGNDGLDHFVRGNYDGTTMSAYLDEVFLGSVTGTLNLTLNGTFHLGRVQNNADYFSGLIGRSGWANRPLTVAEGAALYAGGPGPASSPGVGVTSSNLIVPLSPTATRFYQVQEGLSFAVGSTPQVVPSSTFVGTLKVSGVGRIVSVSQINPSYQSWQAGRQSNIIVP